MTTTLCFVGARRGNVFMNELLAAVAHEVEEAGMPTELAFDSLPEGEGRAYVLIPHEYYECVRDEHWPTRAQLARTIAFCTEQPGTHWFDLGAMYARSAGAVVDIYKGCGSRPRAEGDSRRALPARLHELLGSLGARRERRAAGRRPPPGRRQRASSPRPRRLRGNAVAASHPAPDPAREPEDE